MRHLYGIMVVISSLGLLPAQPPKEITNSIGMKLVRIPPGTFTMGSPTTEEGRDADETPHEVVLTNGFYLGVFEVTRTQYLKVIGKLPEELEVTRSEAQNGEVIPITQVTWDDAVAFCAKLSERPEEKKAGRVYRLPTEAGWEYACRAGTKTAFSSGDNATKTADHVWLGLDQGLDLKGFQVGQKKPNPWGLHDMHGGVAEWCADWFGPYPAARVSDPTGPERGDFRVNRGAGYYRKHLEEDRRPEELFGFRSAYRFGHDPQTRRDFIGFRVAMMEK